MVYYSNIDDRTMQIKERMLSPGDREVRNARAIGFPACKGLYPDCPEKPARNEKPCKFCPVLDKD